MNKEIKSLAEVFTEVIGRLGVSEKILELKVIEAWKKTVGEQMSLNAKMTKFDKGKAFIETRSSTWRTELTIRKDDLVVKLNNELNSIIVTDLIIN